MLDLITKILGSFGGSFAFVASLLLVAFAVVHWVTKKITQINSSHSTLSEELKKLNTYTDEIRKDIAYLKGNIDVIKSGANPLIQSQSPISLTQKGKQIAQEINAENIINENWDKIKAVLDTHVRKANAYDIQEFCIETTTVEPEKLFNEHSLNSFKDFAYKNGNPLHYYLGMISILIRDKYLKHRGIGIEEIDKNNPNS